MKSRVSIVVALLLWAGLAFAIDRVISNRGPAAPSKSTKTAEAGFNHAYPPDPVGVERPKVTGRAPEAPRSNVLSRNLTISSFDRLASLLPRGVLSRRGDAWLLSQPIELKKPARLVVTGPGTLDIGPRSFLLVGEGGVVVLKELTITGVDASGLPLEAPRSDRGFLATADGGRLWLERDVISFLGHSGVQAYGISLAKPGPGSGVLDSTITGNYFGIYTTHAVGVKIVDNRVTNSWIYGIDPHTVSSNILIQNNHVDGSGVHGIVLADRVTGSTVIGNVVTGSKDHGIVVFDGSNRNDVQGNTVSQTFDGIVLQDSSGNRVLNNVIGPVSRFAVRISGASNDNSIDQNTLGSALVGAYVYGGPTGNRLVDNRFVSDGEYVRVRADAPGNVVQPIPPRSEL